jgi:hypothetical protein
MTGGAMKLFWILLHIIIRFQNWDIDRNRTKIHSSSDVVGSSRNNDGTVAFLPSYVTSFSPFFDFTLLLQ